MPRALDYTAIDNVILANPDKSSNELRKIIGMPCSHTTMCRRMLELGVRTKRLDMYRPGDEGEDDKFLMTDCKCPRCGRIHKMKLYWTGNGMPRKRCHNCDRLIERCELYDATPDTYGTHHIGMMAMRMD